MAFEIYDNGNEGKIAYGDVMELFEAILCMFGEEDLDGECEHYHKLRVDRLFEAHDLVLKLIS